MKEICPKNKCTGCEACFNICGHAAIKMEPDSSGYRYPVIDESKCANCGLCEKYCPSLTLNLRHYPIQNFAVTTKDEADTLSCASGGAASLLSRSIIHQGGVVYGCNGNNIRNVHHIRISTLEEVDLLKGSKYVQSSINDVYRRVREDLRAGFKVLFIGTPCQVAGLYGFLRYKEYGNLYTADLVCHGVPSQQMLNDNIDLYTAIKGDECKVRFRDKVKIGLNAEGNALYRITFGWFFQSKPFVSEQIFLSYKKDPYMLGFISGLTFRPNCYECRYASVARVADITLSDYWGLPDNIGFEKGKGVSNILINTTQGQTLWSYTKDNAIYLERPLMEAIKGNGQLMSASQPHPEHDKFVKLYPLLGFKKAVMNCSKLYLKKHTIKEFLFGIKTLVRFFLKY